jgi:acid phosphatase type 7
MKKTYVYIAIIFAIIFVSHLTTGTTLAEITKGPYLCNATLTSMTISWETKEASNSVVEYAENSKFAASGGAYDQRLEDQANTKRHNIVLNSLAPSTTYHYRVVSGPDKSLDIDFHTAVRSTEPFTLAAYGDTRTNTNYHDSVVKRIIENKPDLVINSGDLVENGNDMSLWNIFFNTIKNLANNVPYYPSLGNHELDSQNYYDLFYAPTGGGREKEEWYSFDYGNAHIIALDSGNRYSTDQQTWLEKDLANSYNKAQWTFVFFHNPPYSSSSHGSEFATMPKWLSAFEKYGVDIVFNGHDHVYERSQSNGIWYIITGAGGAPLYPVNQNPNPKQVRAESVYHFCKLRISGSSLVFEMIRADGAIGDSFDMTEPTDVASNEKLPVTWGKIKL